MLDALDSPRHILQQIWEELALAVDDRQHAWRMPVLSTVAGDGTPNARTVVLRGAQAFAQMLRFYTDARSPKVDELRRSQRALLVFWSARLQWQLRVRVDVTVATDGPEVAFLWEQIRRSPAAGDYLGESAPGSKLTEAAGCTGTAAHFALLDAHVVEIDWLDLGAGGHRRARFSAGTCQWLAP